MLRSIQARAIVPIAAIVPAVAIVQIAVFTISCGDPVVVAPSIDIEPKIVVQGYLFPGGDVQILLTRNFPLNPEEPIGKFDLLIEDAAVSLTDEATGTLFALAYNSQTIVYEYPGTDLTIAHGRTYRLDVRATVGGVALSTTSTTTVPQPGFDVIGPRELSPLRYRQRNSAGEVKQFEIAFTRSPNTGFYVMSIVALDANTESYVYGNPFFDHDEGDVNFYFRDLVSAVDWAQSLPTDATQEPVVSLQEIRWRHLRFYGRYRVIVYAADENFADFFLTHSTTQELDGNFHAPAFHFEGNGTGVFGSALADTIFFEVLRD